MRKANMSTGIKKVPINKIKSQTNLDQFRTPHRSHEESSTEQKRSRIKRLQGTTENRQKGENYSNRQVTYNQHHDQDSEEISDTEIIEFYEIWTELSQGDETNMPSWEDPVSVFFSVTKPDIETSLYIRRLVKYTQCSRSAFLTALVLLYRLQYANIKLGITCFNMHRLFITAIMISAKNLDDRCYSNTHYARVGGIATVKELNRLELQMLAILRFDIYVSVEMYNHFVSCLREKKIPLFANVQKLARIHNVYPSEIRRSTAMNLPPNVSVRNSTYDDDDDEEDEDDDSSSPASSSDELEFDEIDTSKIYSFDAPNDRLRVLPIAPIYN